MIPIFQWLDTFQVVVTTDQYATNGSAYSRLCWFGRLWLRISDLKLFHWYVENL